LLRCEDEQHPAISIPIKITMETSKQKCVILISATEANKNGNPYLFSGIKKGEL
jgi:hypothetical protein